MQNKKTRTLRCPVSTNLSLDYSITMDYPAIMNYEFYIMNHIKILMRNGSES